MNPARADFLASLGFTLDPFQERALEALDEGRSVLVAAPTGAGKTVVAEYAIARALAEGTKAFYTTPLKALSNQKYGDLAGRYGTERVGLLTGDNSLNGDGQIVVMTTEVLRNMVYAGSTSLEGLRYVVLDEVHYLQNPYRGAVWEEVIIHTPPSVKLVCLSATVSNAEEFAEWVGTVRGATSAVIEERRPVALHHLYLVGDRGSEHLHVLPTFVDGRPNPEAAALDARDHRRPSPRTRFRRRIYGPRRTEVVERLNDDHMLPAIYFIFSRAGCDDAVRRCLEDGVRLTTPVERSQIRAIVESKVAPLSDSDLRVLGYGQWISALEAGVAAHHAGLVPPFKEAVEACFSAALIKVVFATETLSLGINMPARTVVIESLTKFTGDRHEQLTPGEYTQLTGRAGRRGIDDAGYAAVLWSPFVPFESVATLASKRAYELTSSFRPTYYMTANLVKRYPAAQAHHLLNLSFAQFRSDADIVRLEAELDRLAGRLAEARLAAACELGDVAEYQNLERELRSTGAGDRAAGSTEAGSHAEVSAAMSRLRPGDVLWLPGKVAGGKAVVITTSRRRGGGVRLGVVSVDTRRLVLGAADFPDPPSPSARVSLPSPYDPSSTRFVRESAAALRRISVDGDDGAPAPRPGRAGRKGRQRGTGTDEESEALLVAHPVASCPELRKHLRAASKARRLEAETERLEAVLRRRSESLARQFDRVLGLLSDWGYVEGWSLTPAGERLARTYHETDLLVAETLRAGLLDGLDPASIAALTSVFTFESRGDPTPASFPTADLQHRWRAIERIARRLAEAEEKAALPPTRPLDPGFVGAAHAWASGEELGRVIAEEALTGGDFVRNVKQLVDLLRQIAEVAADPGTARAARRAAEGVFRGVVAASSVVGVEMAAGPAAAQAPSATPSPSGP